LPSALFLPFFFGFFPSFSSTLNKPASERQFGVKLHVLGHPAFIATNLDKIITHQEQANGTKLNIGFFHL
jgi:hypothetical protein